MKSLEEEDLVEDKDVHAAKGERKKVSVICYLCMIGIPTIIFEIKTPLSKQEVYDNTPGVQLHA